MALLEPINHLEAKKDAFAFPLKHSSISPTSHLIDQAAACHHHQNLGNIPTDENLHCRLETYAVSHQFSSNFDYLHTRNELVIRNPVKYELVPFLTFGLN